MQETGTRPNLRLLATIVLTGSRSLKSFYLLQ